MSSDPQPAHGSNPEENHGAAWSARAFESALEDCAAYAVISAGSDGLIRTFNHAAERMLGYRAEEVVGRQTPAIFHLSQEIAECAAALTQELQRPVSPGLEVFVVQAGLHLGAAQEWTFVRRDGSQFPGQLALTAMRDAAGATVGFLGFIQDVSQRRLAQTRLEERTTELARANALLHTEVLARQAVKAGLEAMFKALPDLIFRINTEGKVLDYKAERTSALYLPPSEFLGRRMQDLLPAIAGRQFEEAIRQTVQSGERSELEYTLPIAGTARTFEGRLVPVNEAQLLLVVRDITERKAMENELRDSQARLQTVLDSTPDWIFIKDREHRYRMINAGYARARGLARDEILGKNDLELGQPRELVLGDPAKGIRGYWTDDLEVMATGRLKHIPEEPGMSAGLPVFLDTVKVPLRDAAGQVIGVLGYVRDITARKELEADRERLIAELQTALTEVRTLSDLLPVCGWCKKIRDDSGYWNSVEGYLKLRTGAAISHGICPDCQTKVMAELARSDVEANPTAPGG